MKSILSYSLLAAAMAAGVATAQTTATTTPVGYTTITCLPNSDTIVGLPLRQSAVGAAALSEAPVVASDSATLNVSGSPFAASAYVGTHYVKFSTGAAAGKWFAVTANTTSSITVGLNGASLAATTADSFEVIKFWTLAELINPATATTDPATTSNAVVASLNTTANGRRTQILIPNLTGQGINLSASTIYFVHDSLWKKVGSGNTSFNNDQLWPDTYFIIRNPSTVPTATKYVSSGEVETKPFNVSLTTLAASQQDNFIAIPRPIDVKLSELGLGGTAAFVESTNTTANGRRDQLLVFNNGVAALNKAPSSIYFFNAGTWKKVGGGLTDVGADLIPAGAGLIIRKYQSGSGATAEWTNSATY